MADAEDEQVAVGVRDRFHGDPTIVSVRLAVELVGERQARFSRTPVESERGGSLEELSVGVDLHAVNYESPFHQQEPLKI